MDSRITDKRTLLTPASFPPLTLLTLLLVAVLLTGCARSTQKSAEYDKDAYCYNGGRQNDFSCDPTLASKQPDMHPKQIDEEWMYQTLEEIKVWLYQQKALAATVKPPLAPNSETQAP